MNENVTNSATLQDDDALVLAIAANEAWEFEAFIIVSVGNSNAPDIKYTFTVPTGATITWVSSSQHSTSATVNDNLPVAASGTTVTTSLASNEVYYVRVRGFVTNGATAGNLQFQWAQNTSNANATTVQLNSFLKAGKF